jgi:hypothetical protein
MASKRDQERSRRDHLRYLRDLHFEEQDGLCCYCGVEMTDADAPDPKPDTACTLEHKKPTSQGGGDNIINTAAACLKCNRERADKRLKNGKAIPRVKLQAKRRFSHYTYAYTVPSEPDVLILCNLPHRTNEALLKLWKAEKQPITLDHTQKVFT